MTTASDATGLRDLTAMFIEQQGEAAALLGSHLYATLAAAAAADIRADGVTWRILRPHANEDRGAAIALRFFAAVHRLVLQGRTPELAAHYPSVGGASPPEQAWPAFRAVLDAHEDELVELVGWSCQTNEVGRVAGLLPGFLHAVRASGGLPVRLLEIGASAGLQLRWDRFAYAWDEHPDTHRWGPADSPVQLVGHWEVPRDLLDTLVVVVERAGCDPNPVDIGTDQGRLRLRQSVWGDQAQRLARLDGALALAAEVPATLEQARAGDWLPARLAEPAPGRLTLVYHSVVWQYLAPEERDVVKEAITAAGARATADAPLAWVRSEPENVLRAMRVRATVWPGGEERLIAKAGAHGFPVRPATP